MEREIEETSGTTFDIFTTFVANILESITTFVEFIGNYKETMKKGQTLIVPVANVASLVPIKVSPLPKDKNNDPVSMATHQLKIIVVELATIVSIIEKKKGNDDTPDIATVITDLNETITNLNEKIKILNQGVTSNSDSGGIAEAINALNQTINGLNISGGGNYCASGWEKVENIGPFCEGEHGKLEKNKTGNEKECLDQLVPPAQFVKEMNGHFANHQTLQQLRLTGRVDIKPLTGEALQFYGPQINLARARAEWVQKKLLKKFPEKIAPGLISLQTNGPLHVGENVSDDDRAKDRSVEIHACWAPKEPEPVSPFTEPAETTTEATAAQEQTGR